MSGLIWRKRREEKCLVKHLIVSDGNNIGGDKWEQKIKMKFFDEQKKKVRKRKDWSFDLQFQITYQSCFKNIINRYYHILKWTLFERIKCNEFVMFV